MIIVAVFIAFLGFTFVMPFLPLYVQELGITDVAEAAFWAGLALSASPLLSALLAPVWGAMADRFGRKAMFARSLWSFALLVFLMSLVQNVYQLLAIRVLWGLFGGFTSLATAMVSLGCPRDQMSRAVGLLQSAQIVSFAFGPALGGMLADRVGLRQSFYVPAILCLVSIFLMQFVYKEDHDEGVSLEQKGTSSKSSGSLRELLALPNFVPVVVVLFLAQFVDKSFGTVLPLFVASLQPDITGIASASGLVISLGAIGGAFSALVAGRLATRHSVSRLMLGSLVGGVVLCVAIAFVGEVWQLAVLRLALGLLAGGTITLAYTIGGLAMPARGRVAAFGFLAGAAMLGNGLSPLVSGVLVGIGLRSVFIVNALVYALSVLAVMFVRPAVEKGTEIPVGADAPELAKEVPDRSLTT